jgi:hypothetical protein
MSSQLHALVGAPAPFAPEPPGSGITITEPTSCRFCIRGANQNGGSAEIAYA